MRQISPLQLLLAALFVLLPILPSAFAGIVGVIGLWRWYCRDFSRLFWFLLAFAALGSAAQLLAPRAEQLYVQLPIPPFATAPSPIGSNLIPPYGLNDLRGWNSSDTVSIPAQKLPDGFYRIGRFNPISGQEFVEFFSGQQYRLEAGQSYTQSFYLRHDGVLKTPQITFFTARGHQLISTQVEQVGDGLFRVWGSYTAQAGDGWMRAIDFFHSGGTWSYLEIGFAQLELGSNPTTYNLGGVNTVPVGRVLVWWWGTALLAWLVLLGSRWLLKQVNPTSAAWFILLGLGVHLGVGMIQFLSGDSPRVSGWTEQPNLLGHLVVVMVGLVWVLAGSWAGLGGLLLSLGGLLITSSRAAWLGFLVLLAAWVIPLKRWRLWVWLLLAAIALWFSFGPENLGRFGTTLNLNAPTSIVRLQFWEVARQAWIEFPWTGVGWGNFPLFYQINLPLNALEFSASHAHNIFFQMLAESGLLGLLAFGLLWSALIASAMRSHAWKTLALIFTATLMNLFDFTWFSSGVHYGLWVAVAAATLPRANIKKEGIN